jgi:hypothetical protein
MPEVKHKIEKRPEPKRDLSGEIRCRVCGCTETFACNPPCGWTPGEEDLCTNCAATVQVMAVWNEGARRANVSALLREYRREINLPQAARSPELNGLFRSETRAGEGKHARA